MWRLTIHQNKAIDVNGNIIDVENTVAYEDKNPNNLMDLVRYLHECKVPNKTWYTLEEVDDEKSLSTKIYDRGRIDNVSRGN